MPATVIRQVGPTGHFTSIAALLAAMPTNLPVVDEDWYAEVQLTELIENISITGFTFDATRRLTIRPAAGCGFADHADAATNPIRYNAAVGAAIRGSLYCTVPHVRVERMQFLATGSFNWDFYFPSTAPNSGIYDCILESTQPDTVYVNDAVSGRCENTYFINKGASGLGMRIRHAIGTITLYHCIVIRPSNRSPANNGINSDWNTTNAVNCAVFGFANPTNNQWFTGDYNATDGASFPSGTHNVTGLDIADVFEEPSAAAGLHNFRVKAAAGLVGAGTDLSAYGVTTDILGQTRSAPHDIGPLAVAAAAPSTIEASGSISLLQALFSGGASVRVAAGGGPVAVGDGVAGGAVVGRMAVVSAAVAANQATAASPLARIVATGVGVGPVSGASTVAVARLVAGVAAAVPVAAAGGIAPRTAAALAATALAPSAASSAVSVPSVATAAATSIPVAGLAAPSIAAVAASGAATGLVTAGGAIAPALLTAAQAAVHVVAGAGIGVRRIAVVATNAAATVAREFEIEFDAATNAVLDLPASPAMEAIFGPDPSMAVAVAADGGWVLDL